MGKRRWYAGFAFVMLLLLSVDIWAQKGVRSEIRLGNKAMEKSLFMEDAYYKAGFYNSAIEDFSMAVSFNKYGAQAHLLLGKSKLIKNDLSGVRNLLLGGTEGFQFCGDNKGLLICSIIRWWPVLYAFCPEAPVTSQW